MNFVTHTATMDDGYIKQSHSLKNEAGVCTFNLSELSLKQLFSISGSP